MKQKSNKLLRLSIGLLIMVALVTACDIPPESNIITLEPPGVSATPQAMLTYTPSSDLPKRPHTLEGRIGYCMQCHDVDGSIPAPPSHVGRPQDTCMICHASAWTTIGPEANQ